MSLGTSGVEYNEEKVHSIDVHLVSMPDNSS